MITRQQWESFVDDGYVKLGRVLHDDELGVLQARIDAIMLGTAEVDYDRMLMQLDGAATEQSRGFRRATLGYRKIQDLEHDPVYLDYMRKPIFRDLCQRVYGDVAISAFRAMFMNKPAGKGTFLRWHQDRWAALDRDPLVTVWTALCRRREKAALLGVDGVTSAAWLSRAVRNFRARPAIPKWP